MDASKYDRSVSMQCPTCGATEFAHKEESELVKCASCGREMSRDELMHENSENIQEHAAEIARQATTDLAQELRKSLQDALKGSKYIKIT